MDATYREGRKFAGLTIEESAFRFHIAPRTLSKYESGDIVPPPEVVLQMSREYRQPEMTLRYCHENCAIGKAYGYEVLDAVDTNPVTVLAKLMDEMSEAQDMLGRAMGLAINKKAATSSRIRSGKSSPGRYWSFSTWSTISRFLSWPWGACVMLVSL